MVLKPRANLSLAHGTCFYRSVTTLIAQLCN